MKEKKFDQIGYINGYNNEHYDRFTLIMPKGMKDELKAKAKEQGKSMSAYILDIIDQEGVNK